MNGWGRLLEWVTLALLLLLAMWQNDRLWERVGRLEGQLRELQQDLRYANQQLARLSVSAMATGGGSPPPDARDSAQDSAHDFAATPPALGAFARAAHARTRPDFAEGDWFVRALPTGIATLTPYVSSDAYAAEVQSYVMESLLVRDPETLAWQGLLAESWSFDETGTTLTFRLRPGVRFSDGTPLTADDVVFTFLFVMDERIAAPRARAYLQKIEAVEALDPRTVRFRFREPYYDALALAGGMEILARHYYERYLSEPETFNRSRALLFGTGPYRLRNPESWRPDLGIVELERNPRYWGPVAPPFERLVWKVITNETARLTAFRNGEIDLYGARPVEYERLKADTRLSARATRFEYLAPTAGYSFIAWNPLRDGKPTFFADKRVRQALTLLTDRDRIIREIFLGYAEPAVSPFNPRSPQHDPSLRPEPPNLERALALLAEAGWHRRANDGVLVNAAGEPFRFKLTFFQDNDDTRRMVLLLKDLYARAGILLEPDPTEWSVMLERLNQKAFDAITLGWTSGVEVDLYQIFHSSQAGPGGDNFVSFQNPEFDRLIEAARSEIDETKRMQLWRQAERILVEEQPYTFLVRRKTLAFVDRRFANLQQTRLGLNIGFVPIEIYVPKAKQRYGQ